MEYLNVKFVSCPYCIDMDGQNMNKEAEPKIINSLYKIKELAIKIRGENHNLNNFISLLEMNLVRYPIPDWLEKNKKELRTCIVNISELCISDEDTDETKENKIELRTMLLELLLS